MCNGYGECGEIGSESPKSNEDINNRRRCEVDGKDSRALDAFKSRARKRLGNARYCSARSVVYHCLLSNQPQEMEMEEIQNWSCIFLDYDKCRHV